MGRKLLFIAGAATGYVLGTRAGRRRYEQLAEAARDIRSRPTFGDAITAARAHAEMIFNDSATPHPVVAGDTAAPAAPTSAASPPGASTSAVSTPSASMPTASTPATSTPTTSTPGATD